MDDLHRNLIREIEAHLAATGEAQSAFGLRVVGDKSFLTRLRNGMECRSARRRKIYLALLRKPKGKPNARNRSS